MLRHHSATSARLTPGILFYDAANGKSTPISSNNVSATNEAIVLYYDGSSTPGYTDNNYTISGNKIVASQYDGVDACSSGNTINSNNITNSGESAIHFDTSCATSGNTAANNVITEACVGILTGTSGGGGTVNSGNVYWNTVYKTSTGDVCPAPPAASSIRQTSSGAENGKHQVLSPFRAGR